MLGNSEKMRQQEIRDDQKVSSTMIASSSSSASAHHQRVMEKPNQELLQQKQEALKCPRCDSSNTKFCYYNNYSLSQPRHFCKACKRYWTCGGTLRNVPVGGGCRKNKRVKRLSSTSASSETHNITSNPSSSASVSAVSNPPSSQSQIDPLFYGMNLPAFPRFNSSTSGFDHLQPHQMNYSLGLDFTDINGYRNGFSSTNHHTLLSSYSSSSIFANSSSSTSITTPSPIMASLLSPTNLHQQQKFINGSGANNSAFQGFTDNNHNSTRTEAEMVALKEVKSTVVEDDNRFLEWQNNQIDHHQATGLSDPSSLYWNAATALGSTNNIGPHQSLLSSDLQ